MKHIESDEYKSKYGETHFTFYYASVSNQSTNKQYITYKELLGELTQYIDCNYYATVLQVQYHEVPRRIHHLV